MSPPQRTEQRRRFRWRASYWLPVLLMLGTVLFLLIMVGRGYRSTILITAELVSAPVSDPLRSRFLPSTFYYPLDSEHPRDKEGRPMAIVAQINFAEVPHLRGYPRRGIVQFFINAHDDLMGWDTDLFADPSKRSGYHVRFFPEPNADPSQLHSDFSFLPDPTNYGHVYLPLDKECVLTFSKQRQFISHDDYHFDRIYGEDFFKNLGPLEDRAWQWLWEKTYYPSHHKIGGWGTFAQGDPRRGLGEDWLVLLQIDSDHDADIWWGDTGTGHFFIRPEDLEQLDFSNVVYEYQSG